MTFWFCKKGNFNSKSISLNYYAHHWKTIRFSSNGATKGVKTHTCYQYNIWIFGICFCYTNWNYNFKYRDLNIKEIRLNKLKKLNKIGEKLK